MAETTDSYDINTPPLVVGEGVAALWTEHLTNAWQSWPEHLRHLILQKGVKLKLAFDKDQKSIVTHDASSKSVLVNTSNLPQWSRTSDDEKLVKQDLCYASIMFSALQLAEPKIFEGTDWGKTISLYRGSARGTAYSDIASTAKRAEFLGAAYADQKALARGAKDCLFEKKPEMRTIYKQLQTQAERLAYETVPELQTRYGETVVNESPRIVTNVREYRTAEQKDIERFKEMYQGWKEKYRKLIEASGATFVLGEEADFIPEKEAADSKLIGIHTAALYEHVLFENLRGQGQRIKKQAIDRSREGSVFLYKALITALGNGPSTIDWETATQQIVDWAPQEHKDAIKKKCTPAFILEQAVTEIGYKSLTDLRQDAPALASAYEQYVAFVDSEYEKMEQEKRANITRERTTKYQVDENGFAINKEQNVLTVPQQMYFEKLNELISLVEVAPKDFDTQFRFSASQQIMRCAEEASQQNANKYALKYSKSEVRSVLRAVERIGAVTHSGNLPIQLHATFKGGHRKDEKYHDENMFYPEYALGMSGLKLHDVFLGCYAPPDPLQKDDNEKKASKQYADVLEVAGNKTLSHTISGDAIVIQNYFAGGYLLQDLVNKRDSFDYLGYEIIMPSAADYFHASIKNAALILAEKKELPEQKIEQIKAKLKEMNELWPQAMMTPEQYQQEKTRQYLTEAKSALAYQFNAKSGVALQLQQANHPLFQKEIKPLAESLDCRMAKHQTLADALFADAFLTVVVAYEEWRNNKENVEKARVLQELLDPEKHPEIANARLHAQEQISIVLGAAQNMTEQDELTNIYRRTHERMLQTLKQCPALLGCVPEKIEQELQKEFQKPEPYAISSAVYKRINKEIRKDPARASAEDRALIENMQTLRDFLLPFTLAENLNAKIPQHKAFGDAWLNDAVLERLEYAFHPGHGGHLQGLGAARQQICDTIAAIYAINKATPEISPERLATNERLKHLIEHTPSLVIAALASNQQMQELREKVQLIYTDKGKETGDAPRQPAEVVAEVQLELRNLSYKLLNEAGVKAKPPQPEIVVITTGGHVVITDRASAPPEECRLLVFTPEELSSASITRKIEQDLPKRFQELEGKFDAIEEQLIAIAVNEKNARDALLYRIRDAFASGTSLSMQLENAIIPPSPPHEDAIPEAGTGTYKPWFRLLDQSTHIATHFALQGLGQQPDPHRLFCCHTTSTPGGRYALILKMYRYAEEEDGRIVIAMPPMTRSLVTGDTQEHALNTLQAVQHDVLRIPGITRYVRLDQARMTIDNDISIPNRPIVNGNGLGEVFGKGGKLYLRLRYDPPQGVQDTPPVTIQLDLQYSQDAQNYALARDRANDVIAEIQHRHQQEVVVTRNEIARWIEGQFGPSQPTIHNHILSESAHFPQNDQTVIVGGPLSHERYPQDMWGFELSFKYGDPPTPLRSFPINSHRRIRSDDDVRDVTLVVPLHTSNLEHAIELRQRVVDAVKFMLENEADRAQWDWLDENTRTLNVRHREPAEGPPHEFMDASRLLDICHIAGAFEENHRPVIYRRERDENDNLVVTFRLQRTHHGQGVDDWFHEWDPQNPDGAPIILERKVVFPPTASDDIANDLEVEAQDRMKRCFTKFHSFTEAFSEHPQTLRRQQQYKPSTFINDFEDSLAQPLELDNQGEFGGGTPNWPRIPRNRGNGQNGNGGNGNGSEPQNGHQHHEERPTPILTEFDENGFTSRTRTRDTSGEFKRI